MINSKGTGHEAVCKSLVKYLLIEVEGTLNIDNKGDYMEEINMDINFVKAEKKDCKLLIEINNKAYYDDYIKYGECPGYNIPIEKMAKSLDDENIEKHIFYVDNKPVGFTSIVKKEENKYYLGNLAIIPEYQRKGIGKSAINFILNKYLDMKELFLITPADKVENINFYTKKCGFKIIGTEMDGNVKVAMINYVRK